MHTRKMCAKESANLTGGLSYYLGVNEMAYHVGSSSDQANAINQMDSGIEWLYENGTNAEVSKGGFLGRLNQGFSGGSVFVFT